MMPNFCLGGMSSHHFVFSLGEQQLDWILKIHFFCNTKLIINLYDSITGGIFVEFGGSDSATCLQKNQKELALLLSYECLNRISAGTAELEEGIAPNELSCAISESLQTFYTARERWTNLAGLHSFLLEMAIQNKTSLTDTTCIECKLGEALEACGFHEKAALVYAEAARHLHCVKHPDTATVLVCAGLAWKRNGDLDHAESYYASAIQSLQFQHNHYEYRQRAFGILTNLFILYHETEKNMKLASTLHGLLDAAGWGRELGGAFLNEDGAPPLHESIQNATKEQICRVVQSIITKSTSVEAMRAAILICGYRRLRFEECARSAKDEKRTKDIAREFLLEGKCKSTGFIAACSSCGAVKEEKLFEICAW